MSLAELTDHLGRDERPNLEFKQNASDRDHIGRAIGALSNDLGSHGVGHLLIGVDKHGKAVSIDVSDEALLQVANIRNEGKVLPLPVMTVDRANFDQVPCIVVRIDPSPHPPVAVDGVVWVRPGPTTRRATPDEERVLAERRRAGDRSFDERPVPGSTLVDIDVELFRSTYLPAAIAPEVLRDNERAVEDHLAALHLFDSDQSTPTVVGLLVAGFEPTAWVPGAYIQFVRYEGVDQTAPIVDAEELRANVIGQLQTLERLLRANVRTAVVEGGGLRQEERPDYPIVALREAIINALAHRNYESSHAPTSVRWFDDRVEILSAGGPFGSVTPENFTERNDYRNPVLASALKHLGYVNRFGRGIALIQGTLAANGNPPAEFQIDAAWWSVTMRSVP